VPPSSTFECEVQQLLSVSSCTCSDDKKDSCDESCGCKAPSVSVPSKKSRLLTEVVTKSDGSHQYERVKVPASTPTHRETITSVTPSGKTHTQVIPVPDDSEKSITIISKNSKGVSTTHTELVPLSFPTHHTLKTITDASGKTKEIDISTVSLSKHTTVITTPSGKTKTKTVVSSLPLVKTVTIEVTTKSGGDTLDVITVPLSVPTAHTEVTSKTSGGGTHTVIIDKPLTETKTVTVTHTTPSGKHSTT
jgi:hypothetical protein